MPGEVEGRTILHLAKTAAEADAAIEKDASSLAKRDSLGLLAIHLAASSASFKHMKLLVEMGSDRAAASPSGKTPAHFAAAAGNTNALGVLLSDDDGKAANATDKHGCSPLHYAAMFNHFPAILSLVKAGATCDLVDNTGRNAMHYICNHDSPEAISTFVERGGVDVNAKDFHGNTALHVAAACGQMRVLNELVNLKANMTALNNEGHIPMHLAVLAGQAKILHKFLSLSVPVDFPSPKTNNTALYCAALIGRSDIIQLLVKLDAEVFMECDKSETPLHAAATYGHLECVKSLVEIGANVTVEDKFGQTPLHKAAMNGHVDIVEFLVRKAPHTVKYRDNRQLTPMGLAAKFRHIDCLEKLMQKEATSATWKDKRGRTKLHWAACAGYEQLVRTLLSKEAAIPVNQPDRDKRTPLLWAISCADEETVRALLEHGANVHALDGEKNTPIHYAAAKGDVTILHMMLGARSNVSELNNQNAEGETALHWAVTHKRAECAKFLLERGAEKSVANSSGETPLDIAHREHIAELVDLFSEA